MKIRQPAVAGHFYPADPNELATTVRNFLAHARPSPHAPKALIAPHAGYIYSGAIAATAYATLNAARAVIKRVILLGPAHRFPVEGLAAHSAEFFATPLGKIPIDTAVIQTLRSLPQVQLIDRAHDLEHSLEVQLPFLQACLG